MRAQGIVSREASETQSGSTPQGREPDGEAGAPRDAPQPDLPVRNTRMVENPGE